MSPCSFQNRLCGAVSLSLMVKLLRTKICSRPLSRPVLREQRGQHILVDTERKAYSRHDTFQKLLRFSADPLIQKVDVFACHISFSFQSQL